MRLSAYLSYIKSPFALLLLYVIVSIMLMNFSDDAALSGIRWQLLRAVEQVDRIQSRLEFRGYLVEENDRLEQENFELKMTQQQLREVFLENQRLKAMLKLKERLPYRAVPAHVIGSGTEKGIRSMVLDVGSDEGVERNHPVLDADGLVGKVIAVTPGQSIVQLLTDRNLFVSARLQNSRETGEVGGGNDYLLDLYHIPKNIPVERGEVVLTSGLSRIYPPGLKIGVVAEIREDETDMFKQIRVRPAVNFNAVEEVFVAMPDSVGWK